MLHYSTIDSLAFKGKFKTEDNTGAIKKRKSFKMFGESTIADLKRIFEGKTLIVGFNDEY